VELTVPYDGGERNQAYEKAKAALKSLISGTSFTEAGEKYGTDGMQENSIILSHQESPLKSDFLLKQAAKDLEIGHFSSIIDRGNAFSIIQLIEKNEGYAVPLEDIESQLQLEVLHQKFEDYFDSKVQAMDVKMNQEAFGNLMVE